MLTRTAIGAVSTSFYVLNPSCITLPQKFLRLPFSLLPPQLTECATTNTVRFSLGLVCNAKLYDRVCPQPPKKANTINTTYPTADDLSENHRAYRGTPAITTRCLQQRTCLHRCIRHRAFQHLQQRPPSQLWLFFTSQCQRWDYIITNPVPLIKTIPTISFYVLLMGTY